LLQQTSYWTWARLPGENRKVFGTDINCPVGQTSSVKRLTSEKVLIAISCAVLSELWIFAVSTHSQKHLFAL